MGNYILLTETGADIPAEMAQRYDITIVPMHIIFGDVSRVDGTFPTSELFAYYKKTGKLPQTSASTPADFAVCFDALHARYPEKHLIYLAYSAVTTSSYQNAQIAAKGRDYVTSDDPKRVSGGQAIFVLQVARYLATHPDAAIADIDALVADLHRRVRMAFVPSTLTYLKAGGRVSNAAFLGAQILNIKPLIEVRDGVLVSTRKYRGSMAAVAQKVFRDFTEVNRFDKRVLALLYTFGIEESVREHAARLAQEAGFEEILWFETGSVVSTHGGPGSFGVAGFTQE
ncbi:MAG: DegV family protein [Oscillospiraceae bacterium]|nr:DegV family protein [Oscillospiraceae bacterium]